MKRTILSLTILLTCIVSLTLTSCTKKEDASERVLNIAVGAQVKGMDPIYANDLYSNNEVARVYEGLLQYDYLKRPYTLVPNLAAEMPTVSEDGFTYTFKIKKGVLFHDDPSFPNGKGRELVAEDFVYSIKRMADPKLQGLGWWVIDGKIKGLNAWRTKYTGAETVDYKETVEGLMALDSHTLQIKLEKPFPQFLYALAMPFFFAVPHEAVAKYGKDFINHPVGTGPFILPEFTQSNKIVYTRNPNYREEFYPSVASEEFDKELLADAGKRLPLVDKIVVNIMIEAQPRWLKLQKGELDYIEIPKDNFEAAVDKNKELTPEMKAKGLKLIYGPSLDIAYISFNHDHPLFKNNLKLRQAMSLAYDRLKSNELFYNGMALSAESIVPPGIAGNIKDFKSPYGGPDLEKAKKLLAEAGYPGGKGLPVITVEVSAATTGRQMGEFFKKCMEEIGVKIEVIGNPWPELQKKVRTRSNMMHAMAWGADYPDAENFFQILYGPNASPGANGANYNNPQFNALFEKASVMQDSPERTAIYEQLNKIAADEAVMIYGVHRMGFVLVQPWLRNFVLTEFNAGQAKYLNVDLEKKKSMN